jgi:DNA-binding NarL/FixJ family response regulator
VGISEVSYTATVVVGRFSPVIRRGIAGVLSEDPTLNVVLGDLEPRSLGMLSGRDPLVIIMDRRDESAISPQVRALRPDAGLIVLSDHIEPLYGKLLLAAGVSCLPLHTSAEDLRRAARLTAAKGCVLLAADGYRSERAKKGRGVGLTRRELQVLRLVSEGCSPQEIALKLQISVETVRTHASNVRVKLELPSIRSLTGTSLPALLKAG